METHNIQICFQSLFRAEVSIPPLIALHPMSPETTFSETIYVDFQWDSG